MSTAYHFDYTLHLYEWTGASKTAEPVKIKSYVLLPAFRARKISGILSWMKFSYHGSQIEILDEWWTEAGMRGFIPTFTAYRVNQKLFPNAREVPIQDVAPVSRNPGISIFNDSITEGSARERVVRILRGFRFDDAIPPVEIVEAQAGRAYRYKLVHGAHRFYCSLAAGFKSVPTIDGFDKNP